MVYWIWKDPIVSSEKRPNATYYLAMFRIRCGRHHVTSTAVALQLLLLSWMKYGWLDIVCMTCGISCRQNYVKFWYDFPIALTSFFYLELMLVWMLHWVKLTLIHSVYSSSSWRISRKISINRTIKYTRMNILYSYMNAKILKNNKKLIQYQYRILHCIYLILIFSMQGWVHNIIIMLSKRNLWLFFLL